MPTANFHTQLQGKLSALSHGPLRQAATDFFAALGYQSTRTLAVDSLSQIREFLDPHGSLREDSALLSRWRSVHLLFQLSGSEITGGTGGQLTLGMAAPWEPKDVRSYVFFALDLAPRADGTPPTRTELSQITRALNRLVPMPVLVLFRHGESISLAIINRRKNLRDGTRDVLTRVSLIRDIACATPHRAHLDLLHRFSLHSLREESGAIRSFADLDSAWQKLLSVQELNKRFYGELVDWFRWAIAEIKLARLPDHTEDTPKNRDIATQQFTVRLICRLLFAWFLKEMRLVPAELLELFDAADRPRILTNDGADFRRYLAGNHYYRGILQNIFFQALNRPMDQRRKTGQAAQSDREVTSPELKKLIYVGKQNLPADFDYDRFDRIPYLNGGLFDALPEDNLEFTHEEGTAFQVPNKLFCARREDGFTIEKGTAKKKKRESVEGINRVFDRYRFTVAENTPLEEDVALDPELLGLVFENLLAEIDPEDEAAAESARKESGSYYTPRRIVDYMVNEALHLHLRTRFEQAGASRDDLQLLTQLCYATVEGLADDVDFSSIADRVVAEMDAVRVLDPACGSGAFPMGMLHRMVEVLRHVDPDNERWKKRLLERLPAPLRADAARGMEGKSYNYLRKLGLIQKNLYGLDIQPLAALIAKLRFFLTLVIEQEVHPADRAHNYGLQSLPNLETNLLCANSLSDADHGLLSGPVLRELREAREEYYQPNTSRERRDEIARQIGRDLSTLYPDFAEKAKGLYPPPVDLKKGYTAADRDTFRRQQAAELLAEWFKHATVAAPFFNVETFFPELVGESLNSQPSTLNSPFHIVIGNPPYGGKKIEDELKETLGLGSKDPYGAFIARFLGDPARPSPLAEGGVLAYIVSDTFMTIKTHRPLREQMLRHRVHKMIRVSGDTFRATVNCAVLLCQRGQCDTARPACAGAPSQAGRAVPLSEQTCQMADLTNVSIHDQYERFLHLLAQTEGTGQMSRRQNVSNQTYALYHYRQSLIPTNSNLPFFVASPKLFALMNDTTAPVKHESIGGTRAPVRTVNLNGNDMRLVKLGDIAEVKVGLQTGDNDAYLFQNPAARGTYCSIEDNREFLLTDADLERIRSDENLRAEVAQRGISKGDKKSPRYFGGRYIVPYDKGGESDSDEGWMPNYHVPTNYFIDWSEEAVNAIETVTIADAYRRKGKPIPAGKGHYETTVAGLLRNPDFYFKIGLTFSDTGFYAPTFRLSSGGTFDVMGMTLFAEADSEQLCGFLAARLTRFFVKNFVNSSVHTQVEGLKPLPLPQPHLDRNRIAELVRSIVHQQRTNPRYDYASNEQLKIDRLVYAAYGLNEADIREVEDWYARRYPKLAQAQRRALAAKRGQTEEQLVARPVLHLYCDESRHLPHDREPFMLLGLVTCPADKARAYHLELRALCRAHGLTDDYEMKWTHVRPGKLPFYQAVLAWFLGKEDVAFRALLLPDKAEVFQRLPDDSQDMAYYRLYAQLLRGALTENGKHRAFLDMKDTRGGEKLRELESLLRLQTDDAAAEKILGLQQMQSHEARLLQLADVLLGAIGAARSGKPLAPPKQALITQLTEAIGSPLAWDTESFSQKISVATYRDFDSLVS